MKSQSKQDYLKAIYQIQETQGKSPVSTSSLAERLKVADPSVTGMLKRLSSMQPSLVDYEPYSGVTLTPAGEKIALELIRHHRLIETYLSHALGYSWDEVHAEAERLEHVISEDMEDRMAKALGHPTVDPHGDPIPDRDGNVPPRNLIPLTQLDEQQPGHVQRIADQDSDLLRYLSNLGIHLNTYVRLITKAPFNGPVTILLKNGTGPTIALTRELTDKIWVSPAMRPSTE